MTMPTTFDNWKTTAPEHVECSDCGVIIDERIARSIPAWLGGDDKPLCPACHELYDPRL